MIRMNNMKQLFLPLVKMTTFLWFKIGGYKYWTNLYRLFNEKEKTPLHQYSTILELAEVIKTCKWRADTWRQWFDTVEHPEHTQWVIDNDPRRAIGDCDSFGAYEAEVINSQFTGGSSPIKFAQLLSILWFTPKQEDGTGNRYEGHNICLIGYIDGTFTYMDYDFPRIMRKKSIQEVVDVVRSIYAPNSIPTGWCRQDTNLSTVEVAYGK